MSMQEYLINRASIAKLLINLSGDIRTFFHQEMKLAKKEMSEKVTKLGRDAIILGIGNLMGGAGTLLLLASLGFLLAFAFEKTGLDTLLAVFLGFAIIGLAVGIIGAMMAVKGIKGISHDSLRPERTIQTVTGRAIPSGNGREPSAAQLHREALATKERIGEERQELKHRMKPSELKKRAIANIKEHPLPWSAAVLTCIAGAATGGYFITRKFWRA